MSDPDGSEDLAAQVAELRETLDELQGTVGSGRPGPPRPGELVRFTESYTIPTLIAMLETSIRALELLGATLRLVDGRGLESDRRRTRSDAASARVESVGRATVDRVDAALSELTAALEGEPPEGEARDLLAEARALRDEVDERVRDGRLGERTRDGSGDSQPTGTGETDGHTIPVTPEGRDPDRVSATEDPADEVDVDAELESIRDEVEEEQERSAEWEPDAEDEEHEQGDDEDGPA
jgi:hypothetical protein